MGKNADRILKLLVREIELSEHVETAPRLRRVCFDDVQQPFALFLALCQCNFLRQVEVIPAYYAILDQSIAAFGDLLIGLFSVFQTIWISDRDGACESVCQFDLVQLLLNGLAQFDLVDVLQDEH